MDQHPQAKKTKPIYAIGIKANFCTKKNRSLFIVYCSQFVDNC